MTDPNTEAFIQSFNRIDHYMRRTLKKDRNVNFPTLIDEFTKEYRIEAIAEELMDFASLRNTVVHNDRDEEPLIAASLAATEKVKALEATLTNPVRIGKIFAKKVVTAEPDEPIVDVLRKLDRLDFSQLPVYEGSFILGLLSERVLAKWLTASASKGISSLDFENVTVRDVLDPNCERGIYLYVKSELTLSQLIGVFQDRPLLEAALIFEGDHRRENLRGIATTYDIVANGNDRTKSGNSKVPRPLPAMEPS